MAKTETKKSLQAIADDLMKDKEYSDLLVSEMKAIIFADEILLEKAVKQTAEQALRSVNSRMRHELCKPREEWKPKIFPREFQKKMQNACRPYFDWPMSDGTKLIYATKEKIMKDQRMFIVNATGNLKRAKFLEKVIEGMKDGQTVEEVYDEKELDVMMEEVNKEM